MALVSRKKVLRFPKKQNILEGVRERYKYSKHYRGISNYTVEVVPLSYEGLTDIGAGLKGFVEIHDDGSVGEFYSVSRKVRRGNG